MVTTRPGWTTPAPLFVALPDGSPALAAIVQGLLLHEHVAGAYGQALTPERRGQSQLRPVARTLAAILALDDRPLAVARPAEARLVGVCRHFALLLVAMLRAKGVPARARCGFAGCFAAGQWVDHWLCERWDAGAGRWVMVDPQLDALQTGLFAIDVDPQDVPPDRFWTAGRAWAACRAGEADPQSFGIFARRGLWFVAGNLVRDLAALNDAPMPPWDCWGAMPEPDAPLLEDRLALFDQVAAATTTPDAGLAALYAGDPRLRVPPVVFNARLERPERL